MSKLIWIDGKSRHEVEQIKKSGGEPVNQMLIPKKITIT